MGEVVRLKKIKLEVFYARVSVFGSRNLEML